MPTEAPTWEDTLDVPSWDATSELNPDEAGIGQEVRGVGRAVKRGALQGVQALDTMRLANAAARPPQFSDARRAFLAGRFAEQERALYGGRPERLAELERAAESTPMQIAREISGRQQRIDALPTSPDLENLRTDFWRTLASNPVETIATVVAESLPQAAPGLVGAAAGGGPVAVGANSFGIEYAHSLLESAGPEVVRDPAALARWFAVPENQAAAKAKAVQRGLPVAAFDAATAGLAGRFLNPAIGQGRRAVAVATGKELGTQMAGGMAGETAGQLASEGRVTSVPDIVLEGIAELGTAPGEVFGNLRNEVSGRVREQMAEPVANDQRPISNAEDELPDYRDTTPVPDEAQSALNRAGSEGVVARPAEVAPAATAPNSPPASRRWSESPIHDEIIAAGLYDAAEPAGFTPVDQAVRQNRLGRMDPAAGVAEAVPAEGWTPFTSFVRREQMRPKPVQPEAEAARAEVTKEQRTASQEFDRLLIEIGPEVGWVDNLDALAPQMETAKQDATTITARLMRQKELGKLRFRAAAALGLDPQRMTLDVADRAQMLPALKNYIAREVVPQRQADSLNAAIQPEPGKQAVNTGELNVGDVLNIDGEPVRVDAVDPDTGEVTLQDGTRFGRTVIADGQTLYVENVEAVKQSTEFAPEEPKTNSEGAKGAKKPKLAAGVKQGDLLASTQAENFALVGQRGTDFKRLATEQAAAAQAKAEATAKQEQQQGKLFAPEEGANESSNSALFANPAGGFKRLPVVFIRSGLPPSGPSTIHGSTGKRTTEKGVSVYEAWKDPITGTYLLNDTASDAVAGVDQSRPFYLVAGEVLQGESGSDGEPLLRPQSVRVISEIKASDIASTLDRGIALDGTELDDAKIPRVETAEAFVSSPAPKSPTEAAIAKLESLKVDTSGKVFDAIQGIPVMVWNGALTAAQVALRAGARVAAAIEAALAHIRSNHRGDFDEAAVRAELENSLQQRQFAEQIDAAPDVAQPVKDATTNRFYTRKPNESTAAFAGRIIAGVGGPQQAVAVFTDSANGLGGAERTMLGQLIVKQLSAAGQHEAAARFLDDIFLPFSTDIAQTLQAFAAFSNLTPEGALIYAKRLFNRTQRQPRERIQPALDSAVDTLGDINRTGIEGAVKDESVQSEAGQTVTDGVLADSRKPGTRLHRAILTESADRMRQTIQRRRGPGSPRNLLAKQMARDGYWKTLVKGQQRSLSAALQLALGLKPQQQLLNGSVSQLASDLGRVLRQQAEAVLKRTRTPVTPRTARQQLLTLLLNPERMSEVWGGVRATLASENKTDPNVLRLLDTTMEVWSKPLLAQVAREYLKAADVNLSELVRNHYIEATDGRPQATLAAKIVDWLGVPEEAARPLAAAFDGVLREEAEKVRAGLRKRIDAVKRDPRWKRTLASGIADPENLPDTEVDAALMQAIRTQRVQLGRLVREHYRTVDATGRSLAEQVAATAGVSPERAKRLAAVVQARFVERVRAAKAAAIGRIEQVQAVPREVRQVWQRLVELSNLGALDREAAWGAVAEKLKLPRWTPEIAKETQRLAQRVAETPEGITRQKRVIELHNYLARATGVPVMDTVLAFWYANTLSGPTTQAVNLLANVQNLLTNLAIQARHPREFVAQLAVVGRGMQQGGREAAEVLRTGILTRPGNAKLAPSRPLELLQLPGRADYLLTPFRLVGRALAAGDALFFHAGQEARAVLLARQLARAEGLSGEALQQRVAQTLGRTSRQRFRAVRQALREGLSGMDLARRVDDLTQQQRPEGLNENARDYALRLTFNQKPYGILGAIAHGINWAGAQPFGLPLRLVVPFTNVVANVANESLNYVPPIGAARAVWGHWKGTLEGQPITDRNALGDQWAKAALGTVLLGMVWGAAEGGLEDGEPWFMVNGAGPRETNKKNQLRGGGWIPFSLKFGNRYVSFANSPAAMPLAAIGNYFDARRYRELDEQDAWNRLAFAFTTMGKVILEQSFLDGIARIVGTLDRDNVNAGKELAQSIGRTAGNFVIPNAVRQVDRFFDPTVYDAPTTEAALVNSVPFARRLNRPALNVWGEPVRNELTKRFASQQQPDALLRLLQQRGLWISAPSRTQTEHRNGQAMTPDEFYDFVQARGRELRRLAGQPGIQKALQDSSDEQVQRLWERLQTQATRKAKAIVYPGSRPKP